MTTLTYKVIRKFTFVLLLLLLFVKGDRISLLLTEKLLIFLKPPLLCKLLSSEYRLVKMTWNKRIIHQNNKITRTHFLNLTKTVRLSWKEVDVEHEGLLR